MRHKHLLITVAISLILLGYSSVAATGPETGKFYLFLKGQHFGQESYVIKDEPSGKRTTLSETEMVMLDGDVQNRLAFSSRLVMDRQTYAPTYYEYQFKGGRNDGYEVTIDGKQITRKLVTGGTVTNKTTTAEQEILILDYNVYHHYQLLLDRYNPKIKGKQVFSDYLPVVGDEFEVGVTLNGEVPLVINQKTIPTVNYTIDFPMSYGADLWATKDGRVVKIRLKQNAIEAIRAEYVTEIKPDKLASVEK
ncbi:MAG: hypothetical protein HYR55_11530 [Acidobacteria bacterium]|nr:hypothetical protein [Acidobacteriota bacterium]MBI3657945.1 hypothetical protein [Acidobacteriota bacterium]